MDQPTIQIPSVGRMVHFHHNNNEGYKEAANNNAKFVPAIVTQEWGTLKVNMTVFPVGMAACAGWSIDHQSVANEGAPYWTWPEIKK